MIAGSWKGFTLVELLAVILVVLFLAAIAIPGYQDYTVRAQVSEGLNLAAPVRFAVTDYYSKQKALPPDNNAIGAAPPAQIRGKYVVSVEVLEGVVIITYGAEANSIIAGDTLSLFPSGSNGSKLAWGCESRAIAAKHLPAACRQ